MHFISTITVNNPGNDTDHFLKWLRSRFAHFGSIISADSTKSSVNKQFGDDFVVLVLSMKLHCDQSKHFDVEVVDGVQKFVYNSNYTAPKDIGEQTDRKGHIVLTNLKQHMILAMKSQSDVVGGYILSGSDRAGVPRHNSVKYSKKSTLGNLHLSLGGFHKDLGIGKPSSLHSKVAQSKLFLPNLVSEQPSEEFAFFKVENTKGAPVLVQANERGMIKQLIDNAEHILIEFIENAKLLNSILVENNTMRSVHGFDIEDITLDKGDLDYVNDHGTSTTFVDAFIQHLKVGIDIMSTEPMGPFLHEQLQICDSIYQDKVGFYFYNFYWHHIKYILLIILSI